MENQTTTFWPGWETARMIGQGGFGAVYEIHRKLFEDEKEIEKAALKVLTIPKNESDIEEMYAEGYDEESITNTFKTHLKNIVAEYSLMRKMNGSANIVNCDDVRYIQHDDGIGWDIYIKMELLTPLPKALPQQIPEETVIQIGLDMCLALELCKKYNIVHRDIKPQNIFLSDNGDYKLGDFGIAKTVEKTMGGTMTGTYKYMAPEVYGNRPYNHTVDIYSLGLVLYWLLNDRRMPFMPLPPEKLTAGISEEAQSRRFSGEQIHPPKYGCRQLQKIVLKACAFHPQDRYQSAAEMRAALLQLAAGTVPALETVSDGANSDRTVYDTSGEGTVVEILGRKPGKTSAQLSAPGDEGTDLEDNRTVMEDGIRTEGNRKHPIRMFAVAACILAAVLAGFFMTRQPSGNSGETVPLGMSNFAGDPQEGDSGLIVPSETQQEDLQQPAAGPQLPALADMPSEEGDMTLKIWVGTEDCEDEYCWLPEMLASFEQAHPEYRITWVTETEYEGRDTQLVVSDLENAADVYLYYGGVKNALVQSGALLPLPREGYDFVRDQYGEFYARTVTYKDGNMYGYPIQPASWCLYYDKSVYTEEDVKSLEAMLEKGGVIFPMNDTVFSSTFFLSNGGLFYGENGYSSAAGIRFDTEQDPVDSVKKMIELRNHPNFVVDEGWNSSIFPRESPMP